MSAVEIPDAATEAAAGSVWTEVFNGESPWSEAELSEREDCLRVTRAALVAARPHLMPGREAIAAAIHGSDHDSAGTRCPGSDSCQLWFDAERAEERVLALLNGEVAK